MEQLLESTAAACPYRYPSQLHRVSSLSAVPLKNSCYPHRALDELSARGVSPFPALGIAVGPAERSAPGDFAVSRWLRSQVDGL